MSVQAAVKRNLAIVKRGLAIALAIAQVAAQPQLRGALGNNSSEAVLAAAVAVPFWCSYVPVAFRSAACQGPARSPTATPAKPNPLPAQCSGLSAAQRAETAACAYSERSAVEFAYLSSAAYCGSSSLLQGWDCGAPCEETPGMQDVRQIDDASVGTHAFVGRLRGQCVLAFRGTDSPAGWAQDLKSVTLTRLPGCDFQGEPCRVGAGFLENYDSIAAGVKSSLAAIGCGESEPLVITGHSLGGALATLALFDLHRSGYKLSAAYTFGQPRVGDAAFAGAFNQALAGVHVHRVTKADDPFVYMPAQDPFHHVGTEVYYKGETSEGYHVCNGSGEDPVCADRNGDGNVAGLLLQCLIPDECGHMNYMQPEKRGTMGAPACKAPLSANSFLP